MIFRWFIISLLILGSGLKASACLDEKVTLECSSCNIEQALEQLDRQVECSFSYNPSQFDLEERVTETYLNQPLKEVLNDLLGTQLTIASRGRHLLIESTESNEGATQKQEYIIEGTVKNARTGQVIQHATIYTVGNHFSALSDQNGYYRLEVSSEENQLGISYSKQEYFDTILIVQPAEVALQQDVLLFPRETPLQRMESLEASIPMEHEEVEMLPMVRFLVPEKQRSRAINLDFLEEIPFQASIIPSIGTNRLTSGHTENSFSLNLIAGYNAGLRGVELGNGVNIIRQDAKGIQLAGVGNIVGGQVSGLQASGIFNNVRGSVNGMQAAGVYNIVLDSLNGLQASGVFNILKGSISGGQLSGAFNLATEDMEGLQAAGVFNTTLGEVTYAQLAGLFNTAQSVTGVQVAGAFNTSDSVKGSQLSGVFNAAGDVTGIQVSGALNAAADVNYQVSGLLNIAKEVSGAQVGIINFADSSSQSFGLFSYARKGYHHLDIYADEMHYANIAFRTGTPEFHNIIKLGYGSYYGINLLSYGYGFGTQIETKSQRVKLNLEASGRQIFHLENNTHPLNLDIALDLNLAVKTGPVAILFGPSLHLLVRNGQLQNLDPEEGETYEIQDSFPPVFDEHKGTVSYNLWPGFRLGVRI